MLKKRVENLEQSVTELAEWCKLQGDFNNEVIACNKSQNEINDEIKKKVDNEINKRQGEKERKREEFDYWFTEVLPFAFSAAALLLSIIALFIK